MTQLSPIPFLAEVQNEQTVVKQAFVRFQGLVSNLPSTDKDKAELIDLYEEYADLLQILYIRLIKLGCDLLINQS